MKKKRLDEALIEKGFVKEKHEAFVAVTEGRVFVGGQKAVSPSQLVVPEAKIQIRNLREYVGRGAYKLVAALNEFRIDVKNKICADIGSATGGFTEVLLKNGAKKVYAIDTARGKLAPKLRSDPRVIVREGEDIRDISSLPDAIDCVTVDVSLLRLEELLPAIRKILGSKGIVITLFKPQYQTRDPKMLRHGIVKNNAICEKLFSGFQEWVQKNGWNIIGTMQSPIRGDKGNAEFLIYLKPVF